MCCLMLSLLTGESSCAMSRKHFAANRSFDIHISSCSTQKILHLYESPTKKENQMLYTKRTKNSKKKVYMGSTENNKKNKQKVVKQQKIHTNVANINKQHPPKILGSISYMHRQQNKYTTSVSMYKAHMHAKTNFDRQF